MKEEDELLDFKKHSIFIDVLKNGNFQFTLSFFI